ncbi:MAG: GNAT family N-acetyltransferase [Oscillospiraceae bacterium]|nr:GNAT family N-acetyltransferase [Oscillospiraceae bacterium]
MQTRICRQEDLEQVRKLWSDRFEDGTPGFADFLFSSVKNEDIYIAEQDGNVLAMLISMATLEYGTRKGFYLYSACTARDHENEGLMHRLVPFALKEERKKGRDFCVLVPGEDSLYDFYRDMGFTTLTWLRRAEIEIPKNIWQNADFDITTAGRFRQVRSRFASGEIVHYSQPDYRKYAQYLYSFGGSTAESGNAFAVYYEEDDRLIVKELTALNSQYAMKLLQAIRERTGKEKAVIYLDGDSELFLGEGKKIKYALVYGLDKEPYVNLMFE